MFPTLKTRWHSWTALNFIPCAQLFVIELRQYRLLLLRSVIDGLFVARGYQNQWSLYKNEPWLFALWFVWVSKCGRFHEPELKRSETPDPWLLVLWIVCVSKCGLFHEPELKQSETPEPWLLVLWIVCVSKCGRFHEPELVRSETPEPCAWLSSATDTSTSSRDVPGTVAVWLFEATERTVCTQRELITL